ncbi:hypothetical protein Cni_G18966 [Canna indica]|uniref:Hydroxyproline-rich glycoprotein family protein n=1 Tax=Canna indica TaxID=4628 RepID=A0AAQ3KK37_9LILI|nr:hypothetical protein Cni_G18966 [Canna indica]
MRIQEQHLLKTPTAKAQRAPPKFASSLLCKLVFFVVFVALLPLFPSQAPDFVGESVFNRVWELLHLLFVGIAVSYGLFSRRNADADFDKEPPQKDDSPRSFVLQMLHVPSVFDNDDDEVGSPLGGVDESKIQSWSSQYHRNEPAVVVASGGSTGNHVTVKPLSLPVRSLKPHNEDSRSSNQVDGSFRSANGVNEIANSRNGSKESVVLPSPIPWTSRSGRMETKVEQVVGNTSAAPPPPSSSPVPAVDADKGLSRTPSFRSPPVSAAAARASSTTPSPKRLSPSPSLSPGTMKPTSIFKSPPPPAPPPPPPPAYLVHGYGYQPATERKATARSFMDELKDMSRRGREDWQSTDDIDPPVSKPRSSIDGSSVGRSVRTVRAKEVRSAGMDGASRARHEQSEFKYVEPAKPPSKPKYTADDSESDVDEVAEPSAKEEVANSATEGGAEKNEVDKKADEFIAKFREQIRLQRIESIKRSTRQRSNRRTQ